VLKPQTGILLRMLGPLIEIVCAAIMAKTWGEGRTVAGIRLETLLMIGFGVGLMMVVAGLTMARPPVRRGRAPIRDLDLDRADRDRNH
jgi:hypothetical protein